MAADLPAPQSNGAFFWIDARRGFRLETKRMVYSTVEALEDLQEDVLAAIEWKESHPSG